MGRMYTLIYEGTITASGGDVDWFALKPASGKPIRLRGLKISQTSEVSDSAEEEVSFQLLRAPATVTDGSGGSAANNGGNTDPVINPVDENDSTNGFSARCNDTTLTTTSGTLQRLESFGWNERNTPFETWWPDQQYAPRCANAAALVLRQTNTLADDMSARVVAYIEEL